MTDPRPSENTDKPFAAVAEYGREHLGWSEPSEQQKLTGDYAKDAIQAIEGFGLIEWRNGDDAVAQAAEAQVYATLALGEQQRIANLIALRDSLSNREERYWALTVQIEKGLGL